MDRACDPEFAGPRLPEPEIIVIDDGSTDASIEVIKKYEPWLTYWVSERDRTPGNWSGAQSSARPNRFIQIVLMASFSGMNAAADITVIIPAKDRLWSLPKAVESCRSSRLNVQIIVIDDASSDGTAEWLRQQIDITVINGEGWGKPFGVNKANTLATGKYLRYLDSDDWLKPGANEEQFEIAELEQADIVCSGMDIYHGDAFVETNPWAQTDDFIAQQLGEMHHWSHYSAFLFRRAFIDGIPHRTMFPAPDFASRDDRCFLLEAALRNPRVAAGPNISLCHRMRHDRPRLQLHSGLKGVGTSIQELYIYRQVLRLLQCRGELTLRRKRTAINNVLWPLAQEIACTDLDEACEIARWISELDADFQPTETSLLGRSYRNFGFRRTEQMRRLWRIFLSPIRKSYRLSPKNLSD